MVKGRRIVVQAGLVEPIERSGLSILAELSRPPAGSSVVPVGRERCVVHKATEGRDDPYGVKLNRVLNQ